MSDPTPEEPKIKPRARLQKTVGRRQTYTDMPGRADWLALRAYSNERFGIKDSSGRRNVENSSGRRPRLNLIGKVALMKRWGVCWETLIKLQIEGLLHPVSHMLGGPFKLVDYRLDEIEAVEKMGIKVGRWKNRVLSPLQQKRK